MKHTFDFLAAKKYTALISGLIFILGIVFFVRNGSDFKYGIDFQGGSQLQVELGYRQIDTVSFERLILNKLNQENEKEFILTVYNKDLDKNSYLLKDNLSPKQKSKLNDLLKSIQYKYKSTVGEIKNAIGNLGEGSNVDVILMGNDNTEFRIRASLGKSILKADKVKLIDNEVIRPLKERYSAVKILSLPDYEALISSISVDLGEDSSVSELQGLLGKAVDIKPSENGNKSKYIIDTTFSQLIAKKKVEEPLQKKFPQLNIKDNTTYDPTQGAAIKEQAFLVSLLVLALILFYIGLRFEFKFGVAAIIALIHDVIVVLAFVLFFDREVDIPTVVALLTIMGYSLNDTIVIFDRIRENKEILATEDNILVVNNSIHQSLSRTIVTSLTTLFVVSCLLVLGGPALENLSFALFVGVIIGTYSSIFVASPVLVIWENFLTKRDKQKTNKLRKPAPGKKKKKSEDKVVV